MTQHKQSIPPPSPPDIPVVYTPPPVPLGRYSEGNPGFDNVPVVVVTPQQSELNTKYELSLLNWRGEFSCLVFGLDFQGILLSADAVSGDTTKDIWVGICGVSWLSWVERKPRQSRGVSEGGLVTTTPHPPPPTRTDRDIGVGGDIGEPGHNKKINILRTETAP